MLIRPMNDLKIPDPVLHDFVPQEGREVTPSPYWSRRLRDGEVEIITKTAPKTEAKISDKGEK